MSPPIAGTTRRHNNGNSAKLSTRPGMLLPVRDLVDEAGRNAIRDGAKSAAKADNTGPDQCDLKFSRPRPFLKPDPEFETAQRLEIQASRLPGIVCNVH